MIEIFLRSARRQIYRLPGGAERVVNTRCSTVVADVIAELCSLLGIESPTEQQEFSLYCIVQGDAFTMPLAASVRTFLFNFFFVFQRDKEQSCI